MLMVLPSTTYRPSVAAREEVEMADGGDVRIWPRGAKREDIEIRKDRLRKEEEEGRQDVKEINGNLSRRRKSDKRKGNGK